MKKIEKLLGKYVKSINECNLELAREIWDMEESVFLIRYNRKIFFKKRITA